MGNPASQFTRIEAEWIVALAIVNAGIRPSSYVVKECPLNVGHDVLMKRCKKCGREYYADCIDCSFRQGGKIVDEERHEPDLCEQMASLTTDAGYRLANALHWMGVKSS
jgi:hypothetical protein